MVGIWVQEIEVLVFMPGTCEWAGRVRGMDKKRDQFRAILNKVQSPSIATEPFDA